jgi:hypothetical protein
MSAASQMSPTQVAKYLNSGESRIRLIQKMSGIL